jgi:hypothetical protein
MQDNNEKLVVATQRRNQELEEENAYLRSKLSETGYPVSIPPHEGAFVDTFTPLFVNMLDTDNLARPSICRAKLALCSFGSCSGANGRLGSSSL